jgi:uncharacterized RDD family membrane protein YckC
MFQTLGFGYSYRMSSVGEPGSLPSATLGRRLIALLIDWSMSGLVAGLLGPNFFIDRSFSTLIIFFIEVSIFTIIFQASAGQRIMGINVVTYPGQLRALPWKILLRTFLICLVLPAVFTTNGRPLHDHFTDTQSVRNI